MPCSLAKLHYLPMSTVHRQTDGLQLKEVRMQVDSLSLPSYYLVNLSKSSIENLIVIYLYLHYRDTMEPPSRYS